MPPVHDFAQVDGYDPNTRRRLIRNPYSPVTIMLTLVATTGILAYAAFLLSPANRGDWLPWMIVIVAEGVLVLHALLAMWTILAGAKSPRDEDYYAVRRALFGDLTPSPGRPATSRWPLLINDNPADVAVFITTYGEPLDVIEKTAVAARDLWGCHTTWILDDGRSDEVRDLAARLGVRYLRRLSSGGAKAGNVNHALAMVKCDYFCIFDADFIPKPQFLYETLPFFGDPNVAFVQTPQSYGNLNNIISRGAGYMQAVFYRFVQPGRNHFNAAFCVGTNVIFRRRAVDDVGGMYTDSKSEDVWTSLMLHERGWRSVYIADVLAVGDAPETIEAYTKQQLRWATGGFEILLTHNPFNPRHPLTIDQRLMYFVTSTHYLTGIMPGVLLMVPALEVYFDLRPVTLGISISQWLVYYAGFYVMQIALAFYTLGSFRWEVLLLAVASFPIYHQAFVNAFAGKEQKWHVTGAQNRKTSPFNFIRPQVNLFVFLLLTTLVAIWRDINNAQFSLATAWNLTNAFGLGAFMLVAIHESRAANRAARPKLLRETVPTRADVAPAIVPDPIPARAARVLGGSVQGV
ncbi:hypothetical protein GCM10009785_12580 [Brooklawnia cerclae]|uniref:glycosyltransferase family 2 protein n=1 Tax=Brooklawnia cerclae TaxID=349934 RepID=UPI0031DE7F05